MITAGSPAVYAPATPPVDQADPVTLPPPKIVEESDPGTYCRPPEPPATVTVRVRPYAGPVPPLLNANRQSWTSPAAAYSGSGFRALRATAGAGPARVNPVALDWRLA